MDLLDEARLSQLEDLVEQMGDALLEDDMRTHTALTSQLTGLLKPLRLASPADLASWTTASAAYHGRDRLRKLSVLLQSQRNALGRQQAMVDRSLEILLPERGKPTLQMSRW